ncbi:MAG: extracellular solute-binding protein [Anaerolineales bacterium]|nr:extracellular solute-binding protein [Anaerolineales bacterium]
MMTRHFHWLPVVLVVGLLFSACSPSNPEAASAAPTPRKTSTPWPTPKPVSWLNVDEEDLEGVTVAVWYPWFGAEASLLTSLIAEFNTDNPWGITVLGVSQSNYTNLYEAVNTAFEGDELPEVVIALPEQALTWHAQEKVVDLTRYVNDPVYGYSKTEIADFPQVFWEQDQVDTFRIGIPAQRSARFLFYNQTWAKELGFKSAPQTADEFLAQTCAANKAMLKDDDEQNDGWGGWIVDTDTMTIYAWMLAFGGGPVEEQGFRFLTPNNIATVKYLKSMYDENCAWSTKEDSPANRFAQRAGLFAAGSLEDIPDQMRAFTAASSSDEWTVIPFPGGASSEFAIYGSSYVVFESSDEEQLASWLFVRWLLEPERQARWVLSTGLFPLRASVLVELEDYRETHPQWAAAVNHIPQGRLQPQIAGWRQVKIVLGDGFNHIFRRDVPSGQVAAILAEMDKTVTDLNLAAGE